MNDPRTKVMTLEQAVEARLKLAAAGRKLAVTNGCFDLLHRGHAEYLMQARALADRLFVLINSDASVRALKDSAFYLGSKPGAKWTSSSAPAAPLS